MVLDRRATATHEHVEHTTQAMEWPVLDLSQLEAAARLDNLEVEIIHKIQQAVREVVPFIRAQNLLQGIDAGHLGCGQDLGMIAVHRVPGIAGLHTHTLDTWNKISHNEFEIFLFSTWQNIPGHQQLYSQDTHSSKIIPYDLVRSRTTTRVSVSPLPRVIFSDGWVSALPVPISCKKRVSGESLSFVPGVL